jgi:hypothetical protein
MKHTLLDPKFACKIFDFPNEHGMKSHCGSKCSSLCYSIDILCRCMVGVTMGMGSLVWEAA